MTTKSYTVNASTKTIVLSKTFNKKAKNPMSPEFDELISLISKLPNYKVTVKESKAKTTKKLTFAVMREHIKKIHGEHSIMEKKLDKALELGDTHGSGKYLFVRKWFLGNCPEYKPATFEAIDEAVTPTKKDASDEAANDFQQDEVAAAPDNTLKIAG